MEPGGTSIYAILRKLLQVVLGEKKTCLAICPKCSSLRPLTLLIWGFVLRFIFFPCEIFTPWNAETISSGAESISPGRLFAAISGLTNVKDWSRKIYFQDHLGISGFVLHSCDR